MLEVNYTNFCADIETYMDKTIDDSETVFITMENNKNVVMLSEEAYNNLIEGIK